MKVLSAAILAIGAVSVLGAGANSADYTVNGTVISWTGTGWFQVQENGGNYREICSGTNLNSCDVGSPGSYNLINHSTGQRFNDITVTGDQRPGGGQPGNDEAAIRNPNFPSHSRTPNFYSRTSYTSSEADGLGDTVFGGGGNFRVNCQYSHFAYDDPIRSPGQSGRSHHLHMFFGNTDADADTTKDNITRSGNGTCHGYELNRSAYWVPALMDRDGKAVVPQDIVLYYKSRQVTDSSQVVWDMPKGLTMVAGSIAGHVPSATSQHVFWSCGKSGVINNKSGTIPRDCGGQQLNATIYFGQCWDGRRDAANNAHIKKLDWVDQTCPDSHPRRLPELGILIYYPPVADTTGWRLSSDMSGDAPGSTLHADFIAGWDQTTIATWTENCLRRADGLNVGLNCTVGQTGTNRRLDAFGSQNYRWDGPYRVTPPARG
jgi:hypothetical protein